MSMHNSLPYCLSNIVLLPTQLHPLGGMGENAATAIPFLLPEQHLWEMPTQQLG